MSLQESPEDKARWLADAQKRLPIGSRVRVVGSDLDVYIGAHGTVIEYNLGCVGEWPMVSVRFDAPINGTARDGFYADGCSDDEIVPE